MTTTTTGRRRRRTLRAAAGGLLAAMLCAGATTVCSGADAAGLDDALTVPAPQTIGYSGAVVTLPVPQGVTSVQISATGGSGGDGLYNDCSWTTTRAERAQRSQGPSRSPPARC